MFTVFILLFWVSSLFHSQRCHHSNSLVIQTQQKTPHPNNQRGEKERKSQQNTALFLSLISCQSNVTQRLLYTPIYPFSGTWYCLKLHSRKVKISPMDIDSNENSNWFFDCGLMEDISAVPGGEFRAGAPPPPATCFSWPAQPLNSSSYGSAEVDCSFGDSEGQKEDASRKRSKSGSCNASGSKACREKLRRDKLTERFLELGSVLEPGRPPKTDKVAILSDAVRIVTQLRSEAQKLRESNEEIQERIKELKEEKEKAEQQVKAMTAQPGFLPHPSAAMPAGYGAQGQAADNKLMPFISYPGVAMWQFIPPSVRDTSQDHVLRPPVA
ncbi:hypothetical protein RHMOL_Rhmol04G0082400 [Rhododendron molle]|uniref:Uncharacterized protein n=1 Tax=Rhododendron molle TaxID=49168 RepID=A0ACC0NY62_RHOML|nr:hypothetical protein RHMOL_Rhmol04G0082400 [Rhododendron molle]